MLLPKYSRILKHTIYMIVFRPENSYYYYDWLVSSVCPPLVEHPELDTSPVRNSAVENKLFSIRVPIEFEPRKYSRRMFNMTRVPCLCSQCS